MKEKWKDIQGFEGHYQISSFGRVKSLCRMRRGNGSSQIVVPAKILSPVIIKGYRYVRLYRGEKRTAKTPMKRVARLVAKAFVPNPEHKPEVNHDDTIKTNDAYWNLSWMTRSEQQTHARDNGLGPKMSAKSGRFLPKESDEEGVQSFNYDKKSAKRDVLNGMSLSEAGRKYGVAWQSIQKLMKSLIDADPSRT